MKSSRTLPFFLVILILALAFWFGRTPRATEMTEAPASKTVPQASTPSAPSLLQPIRVEPAAPRTGAELAEAPEFPAFDAWLGDFVAGTADTAAGRTLAAARKPLMLSLIKADPKRALERSLRWHQWLSLPADIQALVEQPVSVTGDFHQVSDCRPAGQIDPDSHEPYFIEFNGRVATAQVFGRRADMMSENRIPLQGIILEDQSALWEEPFFKLDAADHAAVARVFETMNTPEDAGSDGFPVLIGGKIHYFADALARDRAIQAVVAAENRPGPNGGAAAISAAIGDDGSINEDIAGAAAGIAESAWTETAKTVYILNILFSDSASVAMDFVELTTILTNASAHMQAESFGKTRLNFQGFNTVTLPKTRAYYANNGATPASHRGDEIASDAKTAGGITSAAADIIIYAFPALGAHPPAWASIGGQGHWVNGDQVESIFVHEFGHNYGLGHANFRHDLAGLGHTSSGHKLADNKTAAEFAEYGDWFDLMGNDRGQGIYPAGHFHAQGKARLNWIPASRYHDVTASGRFRIAAFDHGAALSGSEKLGLRVKNSNGEVFWIGYRANFPSGMGDKNAPLGATIVREEGNRHDLVDATPWSKNGVSYNLNATSNQGDTADAALPPGSLWRDSTGTVRVRCVAAGGSLPAGYLDLDVSVVSESTWGIFADAAFTTPGVTGRYIQAAYALAGDYDWDAADFPASTTRLDAGINFPETASWGLRPASLTSGTDADWEWFTVQWDGWLKVTQATKFRLVSDDSSRMLIDYDQNGSFPSNGGSERIGPEGGATTGEWSKTLSPGNYRIRVQYNEVSGANSCVLQSQSPSFEFTTASSTPGLTGSYFGSNNLRGSTLLDWRGMTNVQRTDLLPFFRDSNWDSPTYGGGSAAAWNNFSAQWDGTLLVHRPTNFTSRSDDSSRFMIDLNNAGGFTLDSPTEVWDNGWGTSHGAQLQPEVGSYSPGSYPIRIQYEDGTGDNIYQFMGRSSQDDHGTSREYASKIVPLADANGNLTAGDFDYFRIDLVSSSDVTLQSFGTIDTYGTLRNASGTILALDDDNGDATNFLLTTSLAAGTYYLEVRGFSGTVAGDYAVHFTQVVTNPAITLSPSSLSLGIDRGETTPPQFVTVTNSGTGTLNFQVAPTGRWWMNVSPASGTLAAGASQVLTVTLDTATLGGGLGFYVPVTISDPNPVVVPRTLALDLSVSGLPDDHGGRPVTAKLLPAAMGVTQTGNIEVEDDQDWFRFDITQAGTLELWTTGGTDTIGTLYAADGTTALVEVDDIHGSDRNFRITHDVVPGTYYLGVKGYASSIGAYTLHSNLHPGTLPLAMSFDREADGRFRIQWDTRVGKKYWLLGSTDLDHWQYFEDDPVIGDGGPVIEISPFDTEALPRLFMRLRESPAKSVFGARLLSSTSDAGSATVSEKTGAFSFTAGDPASFGNTGLKVDGSPLPQAAGVTLSSVAVQAVPFVSINQTPGELSDTPGTLPAGSWIASRTSNGNLVGFLPMGMAHFPFGDGWIGAHVAANGSLLASNLPAGLSVTQGGPGYFDIAMPGGPVNATNGALFVTGAENTGIPRIASTSPQADEGGGSGWKTGTFPADSDGNGFTMVAADWSFVYLPYSTPGIAVGQVNYDGNKVRGSANFTSSWNAAGQRYHLDLPGFTDLSKGVLLISPCQLAVNNNARVSARSYQWQVAPGGGIDVFAYSLPLSAITPAQSGFVFAWIPLDRLVFPPE